MDHVDEYRCIHEHRSMRTDSKQLLRRNVIRSREGLVSNAHRLVYHLTLGSRVIKKKKVKNHSIVNVCICLESNNEEEFASRVIMKKKICPESNNEDLPREVIMKICLESNNEDLPRE